LSSRRWPNSIFCSRWARVRVVVLVLVRVIDAFDRELAKHGALGRLARRVEQLAEQARAVDVPRQQLEPAAVCGEQHLHRGATGPRLLDIPDDQRTA
jgi:hypothetical protein